MFDKEFYPTPIDVIEMMTTGIDLYEKTVFEPSAGSGNIVDFCKSRGANVIACERHPELQKIVGTKCHLIKSDFFDVSSEEISHIDLIIMNPPFSNADKHIQHAFDIAPEGCEIIAICNVETIKNRFSVSRSIVGELIEKNGFWNNLGNVFSNAERETDVEIALIRMTKPRTGDTEFKDYYFDLNEDQENVINGSGIVKHNEIREIVDRYVGAVKMFDSVIESSSKINSVINPISSGLGIAFGAYHTSRDNHFTVITRDVFKKELQKSAWKSVFDKFKMYKYVTKSVMSDINKFVENQQNVPFTMVNIYKMVELILCTHEGRMERILVDAFERICSLSADNSEAGEKWKTNSNYKINRRFIDTYICEYDKYYQGENVKIRICGGYERIDDVIKALCFMTGKNFDDINNLECFDRYGNKSKIGNSLYNFFSYNKTPWGEWVQWNEFFRVRGYKKGTMHFEFVDEEVWMEFNRRVAKIKGWEIPQKTDKKSKGTERNRKEGIKIY